MLPCIVFGNIPGHRARDNRLISVFLKFNRHECISFFILFCVVVKYKIICVYMDSSFLSLYALCVFLRDFFGYLYVIFANRNICAYFYYHVSSCLTHLNNLRSMQCIWSESTHRSIHSGDKSTTPILLNLRLYLLHLYNGHFGYVILFYISYAAVKFNIFLCNLELRILVFVFYFSFFFIISKFHTYKVFFYNNERYLFYVLNFYLYSFTDKLFVIRHSCFHSSIHVSCKSVLLCDSFEALTAHLYYCIACCVLPLSVTHFTKLSFFINISVKSNWPATFNYILTMSAFLQSELDESQSHASVNEFLELWLFLRHYELFLNIILFYLCNEIRFKALTIHLYTSIDYYVVVLSRDLPILYTRRHFAYRHIYSFHSKLLHPSFELPKPSRLILSFGFCTWLEQHAFIAYGKFQNFIRNFYTLLYFTNHFKKFQLLSSLLTFLYSKMNKNNNFIGCLSGDGVNQSPSNGEDVSRVETPDLSVTSDVNMTHSKPFDDDALLDDTSNMTLINSDFFESSDETGKQNEGTPVRKIDKTILQENDEQSAISKANSSNFVNFSNSFPSLLTPKLSQSSSSARRDRMRTNKRGPDELSPPEKDDLSKKAKTFAEVSAEDLKVMVSDGSTDDGEISEDANVALRHHFTKLIDAIEVGQDRPTFEQTGHSEGHPWFLSSNDFTLNWLKKAILDLNKNKGYFLIVSKYVRKVPLVKVTVPIKIEPFEAVPEKDTVLSRLRGSNKGLNIEFWRLWRVRTKENQKIFSFGIDKDSENYIRARSYRLYYGLGRVSFYFDANGDRQ